MARINLSFAFKVITMTLIIASLVGCTETPETKEIKEIRELREEFGGNWTISEKEGCILLQLTDSERFMHVEDSIDPFFETIERITENWEVDRCIYLDYVIVTKEGLVESEWSRVYIVRE